MWSSELTWRSGQGTGSRRLAWGLWATAVVLVIAALAARLLNFHELSEEMSGPEWLSEIIWWNVLIPLAAPVFATVGALVAPRQPTNPIGWLLLLLGNLIAFQDIVWQYTVRAYNLDPEPLPFDTVAGVLANVTSPAVVVLPFALILLLFPTGRLISPRWRLLLWALLAVLGLSVLGGLLAPEIGMTAGSPAPNPLAVENVSEAASVVNNLTQLLVPVLLLLAIASIFIRWRRANGSHTLQPLPASV